MQNREIKITGDGSSTLFIPEWNESYHSKHGAIQEALHVFIKNGWEHFLRKDEINILEFGFGTGLNALLTYLKSEENKLLTHYHTIEKFPITEEESNTLDFPEKLASHFGLNKDNLISVYKLLHSNNWNKSIAISDYFDITKILDDFKTCNLLENNYDLIYYDAFGKRVQPELWTESIFEKIYTSLKIDGLLTTYACNGATKRALKNIGFTIEQLPGPPGKREMLNAWKK